MKKYIVLILSILLIAGVITSCDNKLSNNSNETVSVTFSSDDGSRDLTSSNPLFDVSTLYWKYTAVKAADDGTGLTQGATSEKRWINGGNVKYSTKRGLGVVGGFSQGLWNFTLYGYSDDAGSKLVCQGSTTTSIKFGSDNNVNVQVKPITGSGTGTLKISPISFTPNQGSKTELTCNYTVTSVGDSTEKTGTLNDSEINIILDAGSYNVEIKFVDGNGIVYARGSKLVTICSNLETTLSGSLNELITSILLPELKPIGGVIFYDAGTSITNGLTYTFYDSGYNKIEYTGNSISELLNAEYYSVSGNRVGDYDRFFVLYTEKHLFTSTDNVYWGFNGNDLTGIDTDSTGKSNKAIILDHINDSGYKNGVAGNYMWDYLIDFNNETKTSSTGNETGLYDWYIPSYTEIVNLVNNYGTLVNNNAIKYNLNLWTFLIASSEYSATQYQGLRLKSSAQSTEKSILNKNSVSHDCVVIRSF